MLIHTVGLHSETKSLVRQISIRCLFWLCDIRCVDLLSIGSYIVFTPGAFSNDSHHALSKPIGLPLFSYIVKIDIRTAMYASRT